MPIKKKTTKRKNTKVSFWRRNLKLKVVAPVLLIAAFAGYGAYTLTKSSADSTGRAGGTLIIKVIPDGIAAQDANVLVDLQEALNLSDYGSCAQSWGTVGGFPRVVFPVTSAGITCTGLDLRGINQDLSRTTKAGGGVEPSALRTTFVAGGVEHNTYDVKIVSDTSNSQDNSCSVGYCGFYFNSGTVTVALTISPNQTPLSTLPHMTASNITSNSATLNWTDLQNSAGGREIYQWYIYQDDGTKVIRGGLLGNNPQIDRAVRSYQATGLTPCTTYHFGLQMQEHYDGPGSTVNGITYEGGGGGYDTLNFVTVKTAGCPIAPATTKSGTTGSKSSTSTGSASGGQTTTQANDGTLTTEGTAANGIVSLDAVDTASKQTTDTQHRRNLAVTIVLVVIAVGLAAIVGMRLVRRRP